MFDRHSNIWAALVALSFAAQASAVDLDRQLSFDIPPQKLNTALLEFSHQAGVQVVVGPEVGEHKTEGVKGKESIGHALSRLLERSELTYAVIGEGAITVGKVGSRDSTASTENSQQNLLRVAGAEGGDGKQGAADAGDSKVELDEVVVTGTQVRGAESTSRVSTYTRTDIEGQGFSSVKDFIQSLPQNFNGGASENTASGKTGDRTSGNLVNATGINLRGLGNDASLVLLNGHRIAPANFRGNFVDISLIPLSAIERIDVMPDGASAIYGSDAAGGVVNFILRKNLEGGESRLRFGSVTEGGREQFQASQALGHNWGSGSGMFVYDFDQATALHARDRDFTAQSTTEPFTLFPKQDRHSVLLTAQQAVGSSVELFGDGTFSHREVQANLAGAFAFPNAQEQRSNIDSYSISVGARADLSHALKLEFSSNYNKSDTHYYVRNLSSGGTLFSDQNFNTDVFSFDGKIDGALGALPAGDVLFAVGGQYRRETFFYLNTPNPTSRFSNSRDVSAAFLELHIPLVSAVHSESRMSALELELADRYENYSDVGNTNNPKVGLIWRAMPQLKLRGSYGTSFVAPLLNDLNPNYALVAAIPGFFFGSGVPDFLYISGGDPNLDPQKSKNWTFGVDFSTQGPSGIRAYATYYRIAYRDRIANVNSLYSYSSAFQNLDILSPAIIRLNPPSSELNSLIATPGFVNYGVADFATLAALYDDRKKNLSAVKTSGFDFGASYRFSPEFGKVEIGIDGTYIDKFDNQFISTSPVTSFLNQAYNPVDLKLRARGLITRGPLTAAIFLNYIDSYENRINNQTVPVASWQTVDLAIGYEFPQLESMLAGVEVMLDVINITNKAPPFVLNPLLNNGINYDGANANPLGRFISLQLSKRF
jgi:outer membrane receptor protein involved in Fe transport